jgi:hypothetical protein
MLLCEAIRVSDMTPAQVLETKRAQRMRQTAQTKRMRKALSRAEERYAPTNQPDGLEIITRTAQDPLSGRRTGDDSGLLERLGLTDGLNEPWKPDR